MEITSKSYLLPLDDEKAIEHLIRSSEAMMDLAEVLDIDYKTLSLGGNIRYGIWS
ncbi:MULTISPECIES: hypothetical protein [Niallia]|uniref:hypothetical protein n=1 Tax=Niallia TaxID=2837506 RepID=UPI0013E3E730|nr:MULTISPECIES: hypothetical protein [Niallia]MDK8642480.1 hypothetical protein [Niallia taxi]MED4040542.1 hypothetical protein [Niallia taxi]MED4056982.1 hypothetical protein [Niallia taxi]MED4121672.1 hypothetical protein [Niallia taxi]UPO91321.1 hypothetical protein L8T27_027750 [Niallia sp. Man26]